jgi:Flp pilus assembly protein TadG
MLNQRLKVIPIDTRPRWLAGGRGGRHLAPERESVLLEAALVFPVLLLLILGGFDLNRLANAKSNTDSIAAEIATCSKAKTCAAPQTMAQNLASGFGLNPNNVTATAGGHSATIAHQWTSASQFSQPMQLQSMAIAP